MMGKQSSPQGKLFYAGIDIDKRVRKNHPLRKINKFVDFDFTYEEVKDKYGDNGNVSVPPPVILKLMLLLVFYNVRSERELAETLPERIDWLWFLGYDFDSEIPDHSVLSKARKRWGVETFKRFFERIVFQCVEAGLVDGSKLFLDSSLIEADASYNSLVDTHSLKRYLNKSYIELEKRLEEESELEDSNNSEGRDRKGDGKINNRYISTTDPDASVATHGKKSKLSYHTHRAVDGAYEIITATELTPGEVNEAQKLTSLIDTHHDNTGRQAETVVADTKYGTIDNYLSCCDRGVHSHIPDLSKKYKNKGRGKDIFSEERFTYDEQSDTYICPAGKQLNQRALYKKRQSVFYTRAKKQCRACELKPQCTRSKAKGRTIKRHLRQEDLDKMRATAQTQSSRRDIKTRQHLMERSFARSTRYGYKKSRWRRLWKNQIQEYLTAAIQNIEVLIRHGNEPKKSAVMAVLVEKTEKRVFTQVLLTLVYLLKVPIKAIPYYNRGLIGAT